jgi:hypothetical protein
MRGCKRGAIVDETLSRDLNEKSYKHSDICRDWIVFVR